MFNSKLIFVLLSLAGACSGQVYSVTVTAGGSGYTSVPTVTATSGGCSSEPTFAATIATGTVNSIVPTFAGTGCTSAPTLAITGGGGSSATATDALLPYNQAILASTPSCSSQTPQPCVNGAFVTYYYECDLIVPQQRVKYYMANNNPMPGTSQTSQIIASSLAAIPALVTDWNNGVFTIYDSWFIPPSNVTLATVEAEINTACATAQTNLNAWNPWVNYSTFYNPITATWTAQGAQ